MSIDINLINKETSENSKDVRLRKIKSISFITLFVVGLLSIVLFLINFRFSANYVKRQQNELITGLSPYDETASKIFLLNQRLSDISEILSNRKKHHKKASKIIENIPTTVVITEFRIDDSGIQIEVSSSSLLQLNNFLNNILSLSESKFIESVVFDGLSYSKSEFLMKIRAK